MMITVDSITEIHSGFVTLCAWSSPFLLSISRAPGVSLKPSPKGRAPPQARRRRQAPRAWYRCLSRPIAP